MRWLGLSVMIRKWCLSCLLSSFSLRSYFSTCRCLSTSASFLSFLVISSLVFSPPLILNFSSSFLTLLPSPPLARAHLVVSSQLFRSFALSLPDSSSSSSSSSPLLTYPLLPSHCLLSSPWISPPPSSDSFHFSPWDIPSFWFPQHHIPFPFFSAPRLFFPFVSPLLTVVKLWLITSGCFNPFVSGEQWRVRRWVRVGWGQDKKALKEKKEIPLFLSHQGKIRVDISPSEAEKCSFFLLFS